MKINFKRVIKTSLILSTITSFIGLFFMLPKDMLYVTSILGAAFLLWAVIKILWTVQEIMKK